MTNEPVLVKDEEIMNQAKDIIVAVTKMLAKRHKRKPPIAVSVITVFAALLDEAKEVAVNCGYDHEAIEAWTDWGERWGDAVRNGRDFSEGDIAAYRLAISKYPKGAELLPGFKAPEI